MQSSQSVPQSSGYSQNRSLLQSTGSQAVHSVRQGQAQNNAAGFLNVGYRSQMGSRMNTSASQPVLNTADQKFQTATNRNQTYNLSENQVRDFMNQLQNFNKEFGYSRDPEVVQEEKLAKNDLYRELNDVQSLHYNKYFYGLAPDDPKNRFYYGMNNQGYYNHNNVYVPSGDINDGNLMANGNFRLQAEGRQNGYYYSQMRANEFKKHLGVGRILGNNERQSEIDPKILDTANAILQHQERLKIRLRDKYRRANQGLRKVPEDQKVQQKNIQIYQYRNRQLLAIYSNIENQQKMVLELVNSTITAREKDLEKKNQELKRKIEELERQQTVDPISESDSDDEDDNQRIGTKKQSQISSPKKFGLPGTRNAPNLQGQRKSLPFQDDDEEVEHEFADEYIDHGIEGVLDKYQGQVGKLNDSSQLPGDQGKMMNQSQGKGFTLQRKDKYSYEDPDMKKRPTTPLYLDGLNMNIPSQIRVPAFFPDMPETQKMLIFRRQDNKNQIDQENKQEKTVLNHCYKDQQDYFTFLISIQGLPESDRSDDLLRNMQGWDDKLMKEQQKQEQEQQMKRDKNNMLKDRFKEALRRKYGLGKVKDKRRRKVKLFAFFVFLSLWYQVQKNKVGKRQKAIQDMENGIRIYTEVGRQFMLKAVKNILINLVNEPDLDLSVNDLPKSHGQTLSRQQQNKIVKIQVRIKGLLQNIFNAANPQEFPQALSKFLGLYTQDGAYVPKKYLSNFEQSRLKIDSYGAMQEQSFDQQSLMVGFFLFTKILVGQLLLQADQYVGIRTDKNQLLKKNLQVLATFIQEIVADYFIQKAQVISPVPNPQDDGVRQNLIPSQELDAFFKFCDKQWRTFFRNHEKDRNDDGQSEGHFKVAILHEQWYQHLAQQKSQLQHIEIMISIKEKSLKRQIMQRDGILMNRNMLSSFNISIEEESNRDYKNFLGQAKMTRFSFHQDDNEAGDTLGFLDIKKPSNKYKDFQPFPKEQEIKIDNGLSDIKKPYYPDFGMPTFYQFEDSQPANWKKMLQKEREEREKQEKLNLLQGNLGLKRRLTLTKNKDFREQEEKNLENSLISNPRMQKRYIQMGSKFKKLKTDVSIINQQYELFGGFLEHIRQQNLRKLNQSIDFTVHKSQKLDSNPSFIRRSFQRDRREGNNDNEMNFELDSRQNISMFDKYKQRILSTTNKSFQIQQNQQNQTRKDRDSENPYSRTIPNTINNSPILSPTGQPKFIFKDRELYARRFEQKLQMLESKRIQLSENIYDKKDSLRVKSQLKQWLNENKLNNKSNNYMEFIDKMNNKKGKKKRDRRVSTSIDFKRQIESPEISDSGEGRDIKPGEKFLNDKLFSDMSDQLTQTQTPLEKIDEKKKNYKVKKLPKMKLHTSSLKKRKIMETLNIYKNAIVLE
ncbi:UNKNOWN [Stylonychia lemnae]|uniref:Uncharacterized protein n=1 Tax=Stylonychia lemnae TaxID=5949 RepID=A0A078AI10_STYLE|nr:UNKNOWN [Stylonychia lemnae]|eukprot:CDW80428.1 UNKNOWN [Stylonychia lemnae]